MSVIDPSILFYTTYTAIAALVLFHTVLLLTLVRSVYALNHALASSNAMSLPPDMLQGSLPIGSEAPAFAAVDVSGKPFESLSHPDPITAILFVSTSCSSCATTLAEIDAISQRVDDQLVVVCRGTDDECTELSDRYRIAVPVLVDEQNDIAHTFGVNAVPMAVVLDADGLIEQYGFPGNGITEMPGLARRSAVVDAGEVEHAPTS